MLIPKRLRAKINFAIIITCLVLASIFSVLLTMYETHRRENVIDNVELSLKDMLEQHNLQLSDELFAEHELAVSAILDKMVVREGVLSVTVFDSMGDPFAGTGETLPEALPASKREALAKQASYQMHSLDGQRF